jgi:ATP-dependent Clp protease ATP-binding subunit ClpC
MEYSNEVAKAIKESKVIAIEIGSKTIRPEHLFLALISDDESEAYQVLREMNLNIDAIKLTLKSWSNQYQYQIGVNKLRSNSAIALDSQTEEILKKSKKFAEEMEADEVSSEHVFYCILDEDNNVVSDLFNKTPEIYKKLKLRLRNEESDIYNDSENEEDSDMMEEEPKEKPNKNSKTKLIDQFGTDLTKLAKEGSLDPVVGRKSEIKRISQILARRKKNNPVLVGEPGVGKSAIAEGIALLINEGNVPESLKEKRIIALDMGSLVAGTKYRGEFEQRMRGIIKEMEVNPNIILFLDEIHTIVGAGSAQGSLDASNMLKPALARGTFQCIGATTLDEYRKYIEKDGALERRFQKVLVEATSKAETIEILKNIKNKYEDHHSVIYTDEAIVACVELTDKYMSEKCLPDKAIDALDEAGSKVHVNRNINTPIKIQNLEKKLNKVFLEKEECVHTQQFEEAANKRDIERELKKELEKEKELWKAERSKHRETVTKDDVAEVVALMTKIPVDNVSSDENKKLKTMSTKVKGIVIGQDEAVDKLVRAVKRARIGIKDPKKPIGSFIFLGPTGVGKTYLAKVLAKELFGSEDSMIRIDMSEYMEKHTVSRLVGAPPGYVGYEDGGELTEAVRRKPYSIILLDEIEKAHPDVYNILLQLLDDGVLTDSFGRRVDFKNTIIIMTSNAGSRKLKEFGTGIGFSLKTDNTQKDQNDVINKELKKVFAPEFLNRIDEVIMFNSLTKENIGGIVDVEIKSTIQRLKEIGYDVTITQSLKDYLFEIGYDPDFGARPLKRAIQKNIEDRITDAIINEEIVSGDRISLRYDKSEVKLVKLSSKDNINSEDLLTDQTPII